MSPSSLDHPTPLAFQSICRNKIADFAYFPDPFFIRPREGSRNRKGLEMGHSTRSDLNIYFIGVTSPGHTSRNSIFKGCRGKIAKNQYPAQ